MRTRPAFFPSDSTIRENENNSDFHATGALPVLPITFFLPETLTRIIFGHLLVVCALLVFNRYDKTFHIPSFITHFLLSVILHIQYQHSMQASIKLTVIIMLCIVSRVLDCVCARVCSTIQPVHIVIRVIKMATLSGS